MSYAAGILVGGSGRRAGGAVKALLPYRGRPILDRQLDVLSGRARSIYLLTSNPAPFASYDLECVADVSAGEGPLAAVVAVLSVIETEWVFIVAGDMPLLSGRVIDHLAERAARAAGASVVCPIIDGVPQVLHAFYSTRARSHLERCFHSGQRSLRDIIQQQPTCEWIQERALQQIDAGLTFATNVNSRQQLE